MQHQEFAPSAELKDTIKCFWHFKKDFDRSSSFEVVPDGYVELIFYFGSLRSDFYQGGLQELPSPFMLGLLNQTAVFHGQGHLEIIAVRCFPWTVFQLLGLPSGNDSLRILEHPIAQFQAQLNEYVQSAKIADAVALLEKYFLDAQAQLATDSTLLKAGTAMKKAKGTIAVSQVAAAAHATVRTLERKFRQSSGHTVKDVSGLMRFEQVRNRLWSDPDCNIASLAYEFGYTDQSHLSREFKRYSGTTPALFAKKAKKGEGRP